MPRYQPDLLAKGSDRATLLTSPRAGCCPTAGRRASTSVSTRVCAAGIRSCFSTPVSVGSRPSLHLGYPCGCPFHCALLQFGPPAPPALAWAYTPVPGAPYAAAWPAAAPPYPLLHTPGAHSPVDPPRGLPCHPAGPAWAGAACGGGCAMDVEADGARWPCEGRPGSPGRPEGCAGGAAF